jgi:hypothetical protein
MGAHPARTLFEVVHGRFNTCILLHLYLARVGTLVTSRPSDLVGE